MNSVRNERADHTIEPTVKDKKKYCEQGYTIKFNKLDEMKKFLKDKNYRN